MKRRRHPPRITPQRGTYRLAIAVADQDGTLLPVTKHPPWTELSGSHLIINAAPIRYR